MTGRVLVVDDREGIRTFIADVLASAGYETTTASDGREALDLMGAGGFDLIITDLKMPRMDGMELLSRVAERDPGVPVIVLTAHGTIDNAVEAMKLGAFDYLTKPLEGPAQLRSLVRRAIEHRPSAAAVGDPGGSEMVARDPATLRIVDLISRVAPTDATVLLQGESGTGKEVAAREIHRLSKRGGAPFVAVNCAAMAPQLVESEMFGHERGAFTGATEQRKGRFEAADGGTLFLDEVGELSGELQAKLLRVLQERRFERVGGADSIEVDVRVLAATNRDLERMISEGTFREDLFHRLSVFPMTLPPLRDRPGDLEPLAGRLLAAIGRGMGRDALYLEEGAIARLAEHSWPGNVRELRNVLERAVIMADGDGIGAGDLTLGPAVSRGGGEDDQLNLKQMEREAIRKALEKTDGHRKKAAEMLGIGLRTLYNKLKEYGLE